MSAGSRSSSAARCSSSRGAAPSLSEEGEKLIDFARRMMQIEAGALAALSRKGLSGRVRLGIPDDYSEFFLADILTRFCQRHPLVEISVVCDASVSLAAPVHARALDLAVVTDTEGMKGVEIIREEPLVWVASQALPGRPGRADAARAVEHDLRSGARSAEEALRACNRATRPLLASNNYSAIAPVVRAGLAVTILPLGTVPADLRVLGRGVGCRACRCRAWASSTRRASQSQEAAALADAIRATVGGDMKPA